MTDDRPELTKEVLDAIVQKRLAEDLAKLAAGQARAERRGGPDAERK